MICVLLHGKLTPRDRFNLVIGAHRYISNTRPLSQTPYTGEHQSV